ncbi:hypothetical protein K438DRAFT_756280 [Mycena galopus ATCC 62051]|nr:hypothetical protein K438DRAFT_756280 [Mycena galopus ATCC 62051]
MTSPSFASTPLSEPATFAICTECPILRSKIASLEATLATERRRAKAKEKQMGKECERLQARISELEGLRLSARKMTAKLRNSPRPIAIHRNSKTRRLNPLPNASKPTHLPIVRRQRHRRPHPRRPSRPPPATESPHPNHAPSPNRNVPSSSRHRI